MKIALYGRSVKLSGFKPFYETLANLLNTHDIDFEVYSEFAKFLDKSYNIQCKSCEKEFITPSNFDFLVSLGGDGTALDTLQIVKESGLPVMGINLGRLGFLANIKMDEVEEAVLSLKNGNTTIETRTVIEIVSNIKAINKFPYALNDFVVQKRDTSAMITVKASLNGNFLNNYWSDGLIIATPTGSSGYSLSCGGPLIFPGSKALIITPIAAHNLTVRPVVIPDNNILEIDTSGRADTVLITLDSRSFIVPSNTKLIIKRAPFDFHMLQLKGTTYMDTIRNKLLWGADKRDPN